MSQGRLEVIMGPMYCGKTEEMIRRLRRAAAADSLIVAFKPLIDDRYEVEHITSHNGTKWNCLPVSKAEKMISLSRPYATVGIDETQFFPTEEIISVVDSLVKAGKTVIVAGLDMTYRKEPFGAMPHLAMIADSLIKLDSICHVCKELAIYTQRLVDGQPAPFTGETIVVGGLETYEARCRRCYIAG